MGILERIIEQLDHLIWKSGIPVGEEVIPFIAIALLGTGVFLTLKLRFVQLRHLGHGFAVTTGKYDDPNEPGDVPHFQALTTALSATVGIGNIAGVAIAIHWGGPGALFWMWVTALLGMAIKYTEVTLAQAYRNVDTGDKYGTVSGGPMYYIERGLGPRWRWMALAFAGMLAYTAFFTGNAVQANTVADAMFTTFSVPKVATGLITAAIVAAVILGGITRIGRVTGILAPVMAGIYVVGALFIVVANYEQIVPSLALIVQEAFNPTAGVAGTGTGAFLVTMMWGIRRGLFSNEAGQGSAPIAHAAAKTDEPVSEGVVALLEPFIDTLVICTITGLVILTTGVWSQTTPTPLSLSAGDFSYVQLNDKGRYAPVDPPSTDIVITDGKQVSDDDNPVRFAWHEAPVEEFFVDEVLTTRFDGVILPTQGIAKGTDGSTISTLYGPAVESGAGLTMLAFRKGLPGTWGQLIVVISILMFAISTAISWSYYGDRCAYYLFGAKAILPYKLVFVVMHFVGSVLTIKVVWAIGDVALGVVIIPNLIALLLLSGKIREMTNSYFERRPYLDNLKERQRLRSGSSAAGQDENGKPETPGRSDGDDEQS